MPAQKIMFHTKDNGLIVADVDWSAYNESRQRAELNRWQHYFLQYDYSEISQKTQNPDSIPDSELDFFSAIDSNNTNFIGKYAGSFNYAKNRTAYGNYVEPANFASEVMKPHTLHFDHLLSEEDIPEFVKNLGFQIIPVEREENIDVDAPDFDDEYVKQIVRMQVNSGNRKIQIYRYHYTFPPADYARLRRLINDYENQTPKPDIIEYRDSITNFRERKLFSIYAKEKNYLQHNKTMAFHEFHHIKNRMVFWGIFLKDNAKRLTPENSYRLEVENERSAYLAETVECINRYLKGGNLDDYSAFDNFSEDLADDLKTMTNAQKVAYLTDMNKVVAYALKQFQDKKHNFYDENQFADGTKISMCSQPFDLPEDVSGEQFRLMRSAYYSIAVYNPATGRTETRNLSRYISPEDEVQITADNMAKIIEPAKSAYNTRKQEFITDSSAAGVDASLLDEARAAMRRSMRTPHVISEAQTINVADLVEGKPLTDEHTPAPSPRIPDDKSDWSDDLQKYWSHFEGYKEKAKNNVEYSFSIKNQAVKYTSPDKVNMGKTCHYEMYKRLVEEPSNAKKTVRFENTLSEEQALMLYVACVNSGRKMRGNIPTDLSKIETLITIPQAERDKFKALTTPPARRSAVVTNSPMPRTIAPQKGFSR